MQRILSIFLLATLIVGCDSKVEWSAGDYEVLWIDLPSNRELARKIDENLSIGRVQPEVIAVGSNEKYIVAKQRHLSDGHISYSIIDKSKDSKYLNLDQITEGPMPEAEFTKLKAERNLPDFTVKFGNG